jgi:acyl-CoA dehydrogenase
VNAVSLDPMERELVQALSEFLAKEASLAQNVQAAECPAGYDRPLQQNLASLGFFGVSASAAAGGLELGPNVLGECCVEAGRVLLGGPWLEQMLAVQILEAAGGSDLLDDLIAGLALVSVPLASRDWQSPPEAVIEGGRARLGAAHVELGFAPSVDRWLVPVRDAATGAIALVLLRTDEERCRAERNWSEIWRAFDVTLLDAEGEVVAELAPAVVDEHLRTTARLLACVSVGATEALLASATEFLTLREQFGRPLGTFQALQHKMADVFIDLEHTRSLVRAAVARPGEERRVLVAMAKVAADRLAVASAETSLQVHGGLGFTWELPVHHHLKEALRRRTLPQSTASYRQELRSAAIDYRL